MASVKMGFEGLLYYGAAGSTGSTLIENIKDVTVDLSVDQGDTTVRGDGTAAPVKTGSVVARMAQITFTMINDITDSVLTALRAAHATGTAVALRGKDYSSGMGPDADFILSINHGEPLGGEQTFEITATPCRDHGRAPQTYV